jgi:hypothetical protein
VLLLPFITWSLTAFFFLVRPRYEQAYETLAVMQYPLRAPPAFMFAADWQEVRYFETTLGKHLLVKQHGTWQHLDPETLRPQPIPDKERLGLLLNDVFRTNPARYGAIASIDGNQITTTTGVNIGLDWNTLSFHQEGRDTRWINKIYDIHYLEWTGIRSVDKVLGLSGLCLLLYMTWSVGRLALGRSAPRRQPQAGP